MKQPVYSYDRSPVADFYDLDALRGRFNEVSSALPNWNHAVAIKTNPIAGVLLEAKKAGLGAEAASLGEMEHALRIVFSYRHRLIIADRK